VSEAVATTKTRERARELLTALDAARPVATLTGADPSFTVEDGYLVADEIRRLRIARGERPAGYKIGFTNRGIWARYGVWGPIWGPVWDTTLEQVEGREASLSLAPGKCGQPRLSDPKIGRGSGRERGGLHVWR
jgi:2-oxo-3-hexenedioate decarboxylase